jgi:hypothetical protein
MESDYFDLREWCRDQVRASGLKHTEVSRLTGFTEKTISQMMNHKTGTIDSWQRILNALPHMNRYTLPSTVMDILALCDEWDKMTKGESPTTKTIRMAIRKGIRYD